MAAAPPDWPELAFSYGVTSRWTTVLLESWIGSSSDATVPSSFSWQNEILLTQGGLPFDLALHLALIKLQGYDGGSGYEFGPVFQTEIGPTQINVNMIFGRSHDDGCLELDRPEIPVATAPARPSLG